MSVQAAASLRMQEANRDLFFKLAFAFGVVIFGLEIGYLVKSPLPYDAVGYYLGRDFVNAWLGAKLALSGNPAPYFEFGAYQALLQKNFGADYPIHIWSYPPHLLLLTWPLGLMPYVTAYVVYCVFGLILYVAVASEGSRRPEHLLLLIIAPAVTVNIWCGQNGFIIAALLVGGLTQLDRRPVLSGILFGLLSIKPQLGLLLPLMLVLTGRWRTVVAATATIAILLVATALVFGGEVWTAYIRDAMPIQRRHTFEGVQNFMLHMPTAFMNAKIAGLPMAACIAIQSVVSAATVAAVVWTFWRRRDPALSMALFVTAIFTVTPYAFNYDMVVFGWIVVKLMDRADNDPLEYALMLAVWATPALTVALGMTGFLPFSALPIIAFGARLWWRLRRDPAIAGVAP
ncbi:MAG: glycosyltransferase family 87 protein [Pseudorhodoplanes sp.]